MNQKIKPLAAFRRAYARGIVTRFIAFAITLFAAVMFFQERHQLESQVWDLQDRLAYAEFEASDAASALQDAESSMLALEETLQETERELKSNKIHLPMPLGFIDASDYEGPELFFLSCTRIVIDNAQASVSYDHGAALVRYRVWDRVAVRNLIATDEYELVGKSSWSTDWKDELDQEFYLLKDVMARKSFEWPRHKNRNSAFWDWYYHMDDDCRRRN